MRIAFFEDRCALDFGPIAMLRPVFELVCGRYALRERAIRTLQATEWGVFIRELLAETYREAFPEARVNDAGWLEQGPTLFLNGRWIADGDALQAIDPQTTGLINGTVAYVTVEPQEAALFGSGDWENAIYQFARNRPRVEAPGRLASRPWELVEWNAEQLRRDAHVIAAPAAPPRDWSKEPQVALVGPPEAFSVDPGARLDPFVVLDARSGPISIDAGAVIQSFTRIEGPCHVGREAQLFRASVRGGTTIGPVCRVGGEVEASILHAYVNKYHDGFLGHSYVCPWVNLGALTTNSDLKNDYSPVRVPLSGRALDTGLVKVGCYIGDHTKTGLGSLFNTGSSIGVMCMVLPGGELLPKHIPSFTAVWHGELSEAIPWERSLVAAHNAMERRNCELTAAQQRLLWSLYQLTSREREDAIDRSQRRQAAAIS